MKMRQLKLEEAIKGYIGGCALRDKLGTEYLKEIGRIGGNATLLRYGIDHMRRISALGVQARKRRRGNDPRTVKYWDGSIRRIVPYKNKTSRSKRVQYVQIALDNDERGI